MKRDQRLLSFLFGIGFLLAFWLLAHPLLVNAQTPSGATTDIGEKLYVENCAVCHGLDGQGRVGATLAKDWPSIRPDQTIRAIIANGVPGSPMPAWSKANGGPFDEAQIEALVAYILTWESGGPRQIPPAPTVMTRPPITPPSNVSGDPNNGAILYDQNCAVCHGANREGRIGATLAKNWPSLRPDQVIKNTIANGIKGSAMPAWSQTQGGPLSEREIEDIVAFLLSQPAAAQTQPTPTPVFQPTWLTGWGGVLAFIGLFILLVGLALVIQARPKS
jgi:mono/diheme cytochrome c family protein